MGYWAVWNIFSYQTQLTEYVLCAGTNGSSFEEVYEELPAPVSHSPSPSPSSTSGRSDDIWKVNLPFSETKSTALKHGPLQRKEKGVFSDQWRKYATVLHRHFLCMYTSEQGAKPYDSINIQGFIARPVPNSKNEPKKNSVFEIVCPGKTSYQVYATASLNCFCCRKGLQLRWRTLVSAVMNLRIPWNAGNFLTSCKAVSCLTLQRGVTGTARMLHALTHSSISRQVREQM